MSPQHLSDDHLTEVLARTFDAAEPVPHDAVDIAYAAIDLDDLTEELATLSFDSAESQLVAMRTTDTETETRMLSFSTGRVTIDIELRASDHFVVGQVTPGSEDDELVVETLDGQRVSTRLDEHGRFRVEIDDRVLRLRVIGKLVTPWITA